MAYCRVQVGQFKFLSDLGLAQSHLLVPLDMAPQVYSDQGQQGNDAKGEGGQKYLGA